MKLIQDRLHDHVVVAGVGTSGGEAVAELLRRGTSPDDIVVIDSRQTVLETAEALGVNYLCGDASHNAVLEAAAIRRARSEEHTSELQSLMRISYAVFCLKKKKKPQKPDANYKAHTQT